jgi:hypothetical protein
MIALPVVSVWYFILNIYIYIYIYTEKEREMTDKSCAGSTRRCMIIYLKALYIRTGRTNELNYSLRIVVLF